MTSEIVKKIIDDRGELLILDDIQTNIPFQVKRVYILKADKNSRRGHHVHKKLKQFFVLLSGSVDLYVKKNTIEKIVNFDDPGKYFFLDSGFYRELLFKSDNTVLVVFASEKFDPEDYYDDE